jgi:fatty-acyl-CoA synthase
VTVIDKLRGVVQDYPDQLAFDFPGCAATFGEFWSHVQAFATGLKAVGVGQGDHVGLFMNNGPDFLRGFYAALSVGGVAVPLNTRLKRWELSHIIPDSDVSVLLMDQNTSDEVDLLRLLIEAHPGGETADGGWAAPTAPRLRCVVMMNGKAEHGVMDRASFLARGDRCQPRAVAVSDSDVAMLAYTSGTTAFARACVHSHAGLEQSAESFADYLRMRPGDRVWNPLPLFHMSALQAMLASVGRGAAFLSDSHFDPRRAAQQIRRTRPTHLMAMFGLIATRLVSELGDALVLSQVRIMGANGRYEELAPWLGMLPAGVNIFNSYGITEGCGVVVGTDHGTTLAARGTRLGWPLRSTTLRLANDEGAVVPPGVPGEIQLQGANVCSGYYKDPDKTAASFQDGWLRTGDLAVIHEDGQLEYLTRIKEMIKVGGENLAPPEIEGFLRTHPAVDLICVVGRPDAEYGEVPVAFVQLIAGAVATEEELLAHCAGQVARWKVPRRIYFVDSLPMSATKVQREKVRGLLATMSE